MRLAPRNKRALAGWILGGLAAGALILPICDLHFDCGCRLPGLGGYSGCDIHTAGPPDCPWCAQPAGWIAVTLLSYGLGLLAAWAAAVRWPLLAVALSSFAGTVATTVAAGLITSLLLGRPLLAGL